mgnify:CR=1 FL=1
MRGKVDQKQLSVDTNGITPAYAGKRCVGKDYGSPFRDHPRLCGEKGCGFFVNASNVGSPPPMRGKVVNADTMP